MHKRTFLLASTLSAALVLSACGGGGGGSSAPAPTPSPVSQFSPISAANSTKVASNANAANGAIGTSSSTVADLLTGVTIEGHGISAVAPALGLISRAYNGSAPKLLTGVAATQACSGGGTIAVNGTVKSETAASNGDSLTFTATNCVEGGMLMNGAFSLTFSGISGTAFGATPWAATIDAQFSAFHVVSGSESATASGDMKIAMSQTSSTSLSMSISGKSFQASETIGTSVSNFTLSDYSVSATVQGATVSAAANYNLSGNTPALGQFAYSVRNITPFVSVGGGVPTAGSFIVNGAASSVTMTVVAGGNVKLDYSAKGDGVITQTSTVTWAAFLASI
ncbi:MAG TPA: hypothetical protein VFS02_22905 [Telluria sp.]|nr:hypothetical protein [Telluria sp.]